MSLRLDLHVHTQSFGRIFMRPEALRQALTQNRLDGIAVTNFFNLTHALWLKKQLPEFLIIVGQEIWSREGHIIALGIREKVEDFIPAAETVQRIHDQGGAAVAVHPYLHMGLGRKTLDLDVDAVEGYNAAIGCFGIYNTLARRMARRMGRPVVAGTDTTDPRFLGYGCTEVLTDDRAGVIEHLKRGEVVVRGRPLPFPAKFILKNILKFRDVEPCPLHATVCFLCGKTMAVRLFRERYRCADCRTEEVSRVACCNGHYFCRPCMARRIHQQDDTGRYENEPAFPGGKL